MQPGNSVAKPEIPLECTLNWQLLKPQGTIPSHLVLPSLPSESALPEQQPVLAVLPNEQTMLQKCQRPPSEVSFLPNSLQRKNVL